jgi:hypothetical protein
MVSVQFLPPVSGFVAVILFLAFYQNVKTNRDKRKSTFAD